MLDSGGFPTVQADVILDNGLIGRATAPFGASTGKREATELRDGDPKRYFGKGVLTAVHTIPDEIARELAGKEPAHKQEIDKILVELDGAWTKCPLGANAIGEGSGIGRRTSAVSILGRQRGKLAPVPQMNVMI